MLYYNTIANTPLFMNEFPVIIMFIINFYLKTSVFHTVCQIPSPTLYSKFIHQRFPTKLALIIFNKEKARQLFWAKFPGAITVNKPMTFTIMEHLG